MMTVISYAIYFNSDGHISISQPMRHYYLFNWFPTLFLIFFRKMKFKLRNSQNRFYDVTASVHAYRDSPDPRRK